MERVIGPSVEYAELVEARRALDSANARLGMIFFLAAEAVFFVGLVFVTLYVRRGALAWPPPGANAPDVSALLINTGIILASGLTMLAGVRAVKADKRATMAAWSLLSGLLGVFFLRGQWLEYVSMGGWQTGGGLYNTLFNVLSGFHGLHVVIGLVLICVVLFRTAQGQFSAERHDFVRGAAWFWYLVSTIWLVLLATLVAI